MAQIGDRLKNICAGQFLGWTHEGKIQLITLPHGCALLLPRGGGICSSVRPCVFVTGGLVFYVILLLKEGISLHLRF